MGFFLIFLTVLLAIFFNFLITGHKHEQDVQYKYNFSVNAENSTVTMYVSKMEEQHKFNSRLLEGSGKMHYVEKLDEGSKMIVEQNINLIECLGDRFS